MTSERIHLKPLAWTPEKTLMTRTQRDGAPYDAWHRQGMLKATPGLTIDYDYVLADIVAATGGMNLADVAFDNWNINTLRQAMGRLGIVLPLEPFIQGWKSLFAGNPRVRGGGDGRPADPWRPSGVALVRFEYHAVARTGPGATKPPAGKAPHLWPDRSGGGGDHGYRHHEGVRTAGRRRRSMNRLI